jgi:hypothetical protein
MGYGTVTPVPPSSPMEESKRLLRALPLRLTLGIIEALSSGGSDALGRVAVLCRQVSASKEKELRASTRQDRFKRSVARDIESLP